MLQNGLFDVHESNDVNSITLLTPPHVENILQHILYDLGGQPVLQTAASLLHSLHQVHRQLGGPASLREWGGLSPSNPLGAS